MIISLVIIKEVFPSTQQLQRLESSSHGALLVFWSYWVRSRPFEMMTMSSFSIISLAFVQLYIWVENKFMGEGIAQGI